MKRTRQNNKKKPPHEYIDVEASDSNSFTIIFNKEDVYNEYLEVIEEMLLKYSPNPCVDAFADCFHNCHRQNNGKITVNIYGKSASTMVAALMLGALEFYRVK